jgi:predicted flavoprotein YhiN
LPGKLCRSDGRRGAFRRYDVIILGAGAAGLMCAARRPGSAGARVLVIDHADRPGKKILISGGGRCNFTNTPHRARSLPVGQPAFREVGAQPLHAAGLPRAGRSHGIAWHEKTLGQLFCDGSARQIVAMLLEECAKGGVEVRLRPPRSARSAAATGASGNDRPAGGPARLRW